MRGILILVALASAGAWIENRGAPAEPPSRREPLDVAGGPPAAPAGFLPAWLWLGSEPPPAPLVP